MPTPEVQFKDRVPIDSATNAMNVNIVGGTIDIGDITISGINIPDGGDAAEGTTTDPAYTGSGDTTVIAALKGIYAATVAGGGGGGGGPVTIAEGDDVTEGSTGDTMVAAGATGTISAKLRRLTQGVEDLKSEVVLAVGANRIGKVTIRNAANSSDIDPLSESTFATKVGEVQDSPTSFTLLDRLKSIGVNTAGTLTSLGEVQASPTTNTVLDRLKALKTSVDSLLTGIVLAAGSARIGKVTIRNAADSADIDPLADSTFTGRVGATNDTAWDGSASTASIIAILKSIRTTNTTSTIADGADITEGAIADAVVAAGAAGTLSAKLRRVTQGLEDLKTLIVLGAGSARIGKVTIRNAADSADIDPLADSTFTTSVGAVTASPTANTVQDRLKTIGTNTGSTVTAIGEVQASPTANTVLDRLKALKTSVDGLLTGIVIAAGSARIGKVTIRNSADNADIDPVSDSTFTGRIGEVQASPTSNTVLDRLKTVGTNTGTTASNTTAISTATGTTADSAYAGSGSASIISLLKGIYTNGGAVTIADGANVVEGAVADAIVAAGAAGTLSAKLRRVTQGLEDLKTLIVLGAGSARIGKVTIRNAADNADIDPLADSTFTTSVGAVTASPTANTVQDRLKTIGTNTLQYGNAANPAAASIASTATLILASNAARISCLIFNNSSVTVYLGGSGVTTSTGIPIPAGCSFQSDHSRNAWYGIVVTGTADVRYTELT